jgi:tetratricopeptide (TPR) repeat protein
MQRAMRSSNAGCAPQNAQRGGARTTIREKGRLDCDYHDMDARMARSRAWMLSRIAWLCAAGVVATAPWSLAERFQGPPPQMLVEARGLQPLADPPLLLMVPDDACALVGMDFVPPLPQVSGQPQPARPRLERQRPAPAITLPSKRVEAPPPAITQRLPTEAASRGISEAPTGVATERGFVRPTTDGASLRATPPAAPTRVATRPSTGGMLIDRLEPSSKSAPPTAPALPAPTSSFRPLPARTQQPVSASTPVSVQRAIEVSPAARPAMQAVSERAIAITENAGRLADRGAFYSARSEFIQALRVVTQALDAQAGDSTHSQALSEGLRALNEADDFAPQGSKLEADLNLASILASHRTPVLKEADTTSLTPLTALQQYYGFAQARLAQAGGHEPAASHALFGMGRLTTVLAERSPDDRRLHAPKAMALFQAALAVDGRNHRAAQELGVLYAQFGQLEDARRLLVISVNLSPRKETWHNLAIVHERLGEADLARKARYELELAARGGAPQLAANGINVQWVDPAKFKDGPPNGSTPAVRAAGRPSTNPWLR